jgi:hypothetical protein
MKTVFESPDKGQTIIERPFRQGIQQVKSKWYYVFWGIMAAAVCGGQIYVGTGYREMAEATKSTAISVTCLPKYDTYSSTKYSQVNKTGEFE